MALYHKYRPKTFERVIGQEHITTTLANMVKSEHINHAYLFFGPRGTGKTSTARILAKAVNCDNPVKAPCGECDMCKVFEGSLDVIELDAASHTGVGTIREVLGDTVHFSPSQMRFKVYIIDEAHMLSKAADNAVLKTLEEPPPHVIIILVTTEEWKIPATVLSRCQQHQFRLISTKDIFNHLMMICDEEGYRYEPGALTLIAQRAGGAVRDGVTLLDQFSVYEEITEKVVRSVLGLGDDEFVFDFMQGAESGELGKVFDAFSGAMQAGFSFDRFVAQTTTFAHTLLKYKMGSLRADDIPDTYLEHCKQSTLSAKSITQLLRALVKARMDSRYVSEEVALELNIAEVFGNFPKFPVLTSIELLSPIEEEPPTPLDDPIVKELIQRGAEVVFHQLLDRGHT